MRIIELQLLAFGPFTDLFLHLGSEEQGLNLVFGPNEAGKSSALRALKALLYGIPHHSSDDFIHDKSRLRIGGRLCLSDGSELAFIRRKGTKNTVLGFDEKPIDEARLNKFLQGVSERLFSSLFGIDHEALIRGGEYILQEQGEAGQSLFAAGLGGANVGKIIQELDAEADSLFRQRGSTQVINKAISEYNEAKKMIAEASLSSRIWSEHDDALKKARKERDIFQQRLRQLVSEQNRLKRIQGSLPKIAKRQELLARLEKIGNVVILPSEFSGERQKAEERIGTAQDIKHRAEVDINRLTQDIKELTVPQPILDQAETIGEIHQRLGSYRKATGDRKVLQGNLQQLEAEIETLLSEMRLGVTTDEIEGIRPSTGQRVRVQQLGEEYQVIAGALYRAADDVDETEAELSETVREFEALKASRDSGELNRIVAAGLKLGDLDGVREQLLVSLSAEEDQAQVDLRRLPLWSGCLEELETLPVPPSETMDRFETLFQGAASDRVTLEKRIEEVTKELLELEEKIEELQRTGSVPSEEELMRIRERRDQGWKLVRRSWIGKEDVSAEENAYDSKNALPEAFERSVGHADELSDRLRREANRVTENASLTARRFKCSERLAKLKEDRERSIRQIGQIQHEWDALWEPAGMSPLPPKEMRSWAVKQNAIIQRVQKIRTFRRNVEQLNEQIEKCRGELGRCLDALGERRSDAPETLGALLERCQAVIREIDEVNRRRTELEMKVGKLQKDLADCQKVKKDSAKKLEQWKSDWARVMVDLRLPPGALPAEANAVLAKIEELFKKVHERDLLRRRISGIDKDAADFVREVKVLVQSLAPDLEKMPADQAAAQLNSLLARAQGASARMGEVQKQLDEKRAILREADTSILLLTEELTNRCKQAGCSRREELEAVEKLSYEYQSVKEDIENLETQLIELGAGGTLEQLLRDAESVNADSLPAQLSEISREVEDLERSISRTDQIIGSERTHLEHMDGSGKAAETAEKAQEILATIRANVDRYVRLRMSSYILRREIERYRAENQGPLLSRAGELFAKLTLESFSGLQTDFNDRDEPAILGVRPSGERIGISGMSEGTRDQLYLSLRLASLERYLEKNEPMPFIVDDILIKFDDQRAKATLEVLAELSLKSQVIFFTHHSRLVDLAREACGARLLIHNLMISQKLKLGTRQ